MTQKNGKKRIVYLDALRIFTIFAVVIVHVSGSNWNTTSIDSFDWKVFTFYDSLVRFCVPVFVMISGVFFLDPSREVTIKQMFRKNVLRVAIAFVFWSVLYGIVEGFIYNKSTNEIIKSIIIGHYHLWFLWTIASLYVLTPILRIISADISIMKYFIVLSIIFHSCMYYAYLTPYGYIFNTLMFNSEFHTVLGFAAYFMLGYYLHVFGLSKKMEIAVYILSIFSLAFTVIGTMWYSQIYQRPMESFFDYHAINTFIVSVAVFIFFRNRVSKWKFTEKYSEKINKLAGLVFGVYLVHEFVIIFIRGFFNITTLSFNPILSVPTISAVVFVVALVLAYFMSKIPKISKYIM